MSKSIYKIVTAVYFEGKYVRDNHSYSSHPVKTVNRWNIQGKRTGHSYLLLTQEPANKSLNLQKYEGNNYDYFVEK